MRLTSKGRYAVRAVLDLVFHSHGRPVRLQEISDRQGISLHYLEQLFRRLRTGDVVKSVRGPGGGYILARAMDEISIKDVLISVGENIDPAKDLVADAVDEYSETSANINPNQKSHSTLELEVTRSYFQNLGLLMYDYLATASLGQLVRRARTMSATGATSTRWNAASTDGVSDFVKPEKPTVAPQVESTPGSLVDVLQEFNGPDFLDTALPGEDVVSQKP